jgi:hypothetical protein
MLAQFHVMQYLYTNFSLENCDAYLSDMIPHNYKQVLFSKRDLCWFSGCGLELKTMVWYLEIDNFIVHPEHRMKALAKWWRIIDTIGEKKRATMIVLDAFTGNFTAHPFITMGLRTQGFIFKIF